MTDIPISIDVVVTIDDRNSVPDSILELAQKYNVLVKNPSGDLIPIMEFIENKKAVNE